MKGENSFFVGDDGFIAFSDFIGLTDEERTLRAAALGRSFMPFRVSNYYAELIRDSSSNDRLSLLNIVLPPPASPSFRGRFDPYGNLTYSADDNHKFLQHKYPRTLLVHITDFCNSNCQFCYKVNEIKVVHASDHNSRSKISEAVKYLGTHPEVNNVLFTGGDPAAIRPELLFRFIEPLIKQKNIRVVRFATKTISFDPARLRNEELLRFFSSVNAQEGKQIAVIAQINHPAEFSREAKQTVRALHDAGVQIRGQPAIVRSVNSDVSTLVRLHQAFVDHLIVPYYFTIFMPVRGVEQYGITLHEGFTNFHSCMAQLNGMEKKSILLASHDFGKVEIVGFLPSLAQPDQIVLRWHEVVPPNYLPAEFVARIPHQMSDVFALQYPKKEMYCLDQLFAANSLPYFDSDGKLVIQGSA